MKAIILNSGMGSRMGTLTKEQPKCMTRLYGNETILSRQLKQLRNIGIENVVITTGAFDKILEGYCQDLNLPLKYSFVFNPIYDRTNYIYSIYLARKYLENDIILMHGDLVFDQKILEYILARSESCMTVSSTMPLPDKDFKAVIEEGLIKRVGVEFFENAVAAQPLYRLDRENWGIWLEAIVNFCEKGQLTCYAENAFNEVSDECYIYPFDVRGMLCTEIDNLDDLNIVQRLLNL